MEPFVCTYTGETVNLINPEVSSLRLDDFLWAAGNQSRYLGHATRPYSNLEHAYWVSRFVPPYLQLAALIHDWPEIYLADLPGPLKKEFELRGNRFYKDVELAHNAALEFKFDCPSLENPTIKQADALLLWYEGNELLTHPKSGVLWWEKYQGLQTGWWEGEQQEAPTVLGLGALTSDLDFLRWVVSDEVERLVTRSFA